tara:strand:+ start:286 stop:594 length:309 start_codon:yes stop_codon:yes gene_type:complete
MYKKIFYLSFIILFVSSCGGVGESIKRGMTNQKALSTDEFLVKKKDPLILPPDFENLPSPDERSAAKEEISIFKKSVGETTENTTSSTGSVENSILKKIQSK